ncbi:hypothetical protein MMC30_004786 [Trapelia coarctata]|nr:hypothetical protein [Trapelia coarctata]
MLLPTFLTTTALALTANAFLIPLEVANDAQAAKAAETLANNIVPTAQTINLDCSTCPFAEGSAQGPHGWAQPGPKTNLEMKFTTSEVTQQISLNGVPFYPPSMNNIAHPLRAKQFVKPGEVVPNDIKPYKGDLGLSYSLEIRPEQVENGITLTPVVLQVLGIDGKMVKVDSIVIPVIKTLSGNPLLAEIKTAPVASAPGEDACTTILCRIRAIIYGKMQAARLAALKAMEKMQSTRVGCMRKLGFKIPEPQRGPKVHGGPSKFQGTRPGHKDDGHEHEHHHKHHGFKKFWHMVKDSFKHVALPIFIGIAAGMAASAVGLVIGQLAVMMWMRYKRAKQGAYVAVEQVEEAGLPSYEDVPVVEEEDVEDEKKELLS